MCSSSSYKIFNGKNNLLQIGLLCWSKEGVNRYVSTWNFKIMFKFKLQDNQWEEHFIPNWIFLPKTKKDEKLYLIKTVWCLGLLKETVWLNGNYWLNFVSIAWSWLIAKKWKMTENRFIMLLTKKIFLHHSRFPKSSKSIIREEA